MKASFKFFSLIKHPVVYAGIYLVFSLMFVIDALTTKHLDYFFPFTGIGGVWRYPRIQLFGFSISLYATMCIVGLILSTIVLVVRRKIYNVSLVKAIITAIYSVSTGFIGAKILYCLENTDKIKQEGLNFNGVSFFGTVLLLPVFIFFLSLIFKKSYFDFMDYCTPACITMLICIRTGCFFNGCCGAITLWHGSFPVKLPVQLFECVLDFLIIEIVTAPRVKYLCSKMLYPLFACIYSVFRFGLEYLRESNPHIFGFLTNGQLMSIITLLLYGSILIKRHYLHKYEKTKRGNITAY